MILPFEEIYCLALTEDAKRYKNAKAELEKIGVENEIHWWWTCKKPIITNIANNIQSLHGKWYVLNYQKNKYLYTAAFDCFLNHYSIIKTAYNRGVNSILVMEDDINFIDDIDCIKYVFDHIPEDYDIIKFYNLHDCMYVSEVTIENMEWIVDYARTASTEMYAMNRKGMKTFIDEIENGNEPQVVDAYFDTTIYKCKQYSLNGRIIKTDDYKNNSNILN